MDPKLLARDHIFKWEGGYVNDRTDPGGETKYGISKRAHPDVDIAALTKVTAWAIYERDYWLAAGCDRMTPGMALLVFDSAVNCGVSRAREWYLASKDINGVFVLRAIHYVSLKESLKLKYLNGWMNRLRDTYGVALAAETKEQDNAQ